MTDYKALAKELRDLGGAGFMRSDGVSQVRYGVLYRTASAIDELVEENEKLKSEDPALAHAELSELTREHAALQARLDAMTVEWGYRGGFDGRVTVEDEEHARRIGQKYSDTYETVSRLVGPWVEVKGEDA
jgi:hypothetical protein